MSISAAAAAGRPEGLLKYEIKVLDACCSPDAILSFITVVVQLIRLKQEVE